MDKQKKIHYCDLCGSESFQILVSEIPIKGSVLFELGVTSLYETVMCKSCGWIFKPGVLSAEQLEALYTKHGGEATLNESCEKVSHIRSDQLFSWMNKTVLIAEKSHVLDVGGGVGQATSAFSENNHEVTVLDMAGGDLANENMKLIKSTYYNFNPKQRYDIIFMNHIAEHVWDPTKLFTHSYDILSEEGFLYVEVPFELITPFIKKKLGDPCHVGYFSIRTLRHFFEKCGFKVIKIERALGRYNERRVMVLRAVAKKKNAKNKDINTINIKEGATPVKIMREIFVAPQLMIILRLLLNNVIKKIFKKPT
jgi:ubiquinone/menaquinone biosynthesis C-methylase UbiE